MSKIVLGGMDRKVDEKQDTEEHELNKNQSLKSCNRCHTTKTPLWRSGPDGPKTLCNACGIKYHKKKRRLGLAIDKDMKRSGVMGGLGNDVMLQKTRKLREEEQAALLLMALSCGSF